MWGVRHGDLLIFEVSSTTTIQDSKFEENHTGVLKALPIYTKATLIARYYLGIESSLWDSYGSYLIQNNPEPYFVIRQISAVIKFA